MKRVSFALAVPLMLVGCGQDGGDDDKAAAFERAAEQGDPEAAALLRNAAEPPGNSQAPAAGKGF